LTTIILGESGKLKKASNVVIGLENDILSFNIHPSHRCGRTALLIHPALQRTSLLLSSNCDPDSNVTEENDRHPEKHTSPKTSTDAGRMISIKPVLWNA
jgi:hypothetical protein